MASKELHEKKRKKNSVFSFFRLVNILSEDQNNKLFSVIVGLSWKIMQATSSVIHVLLVLHITSKDK